MSVSIVEDSVNQGETLLCDVWSVWDVTTNQFMTLAPSLSANVQMDLDGLDVLDPVFQACIFEPVFS
jgi:hypothetical protein